MTTPRLQKSRIFGLFALVAALASCGCGGSAEAPSAGQFYASKHALPPDDIPDSQSQTETDKPADKPTVNPFIKTASDPLSTFAADVDTASYTIYARDVAQGRLPDPNTVRSEEFINAFSYSYARPTADDTHPFAIHLEAANSPFLAGTKLLKVGIAARHVDLAKRKAANLIFLVDTSGSMDSPAKLPLVKTLLKATLDVLRPTDKVSIVTYASNAGVLLGPTLVKEKTKISHCIDKLGASGSTAGGGGIKAAYAQAEKAWIEGGINHVVMCTDGDFNVGLSATEDLVGLIVDKRKSGVTLTALAFGGWSFNDGMMEAVSNAGNGIYAMIDSAERAKAYAAKELIASMVHVAKDVKIQVELNPDKVEAYRLIGYENRKIADKDFRNDIIDAGEVGTGHAVTALYELVLKGDTIPQPKGAPAVSDGEAYAGSGLTVTGEDLALVRVRYKQPGAKESDAAVEMTSEIAGGEVRTSLDKASKDMQFAVSLAGLAEVLRGSPYRGKADLSVISQLASGGAGSDEARMKHVQRLAETTKQVQ